MLLLDAALRFSAITMLLLTALLAIRDARHLLQGWIAAALCISLSGMLVNTMPDAMDLPLAVRTGGWVLHIPNTVLLWVFGLSLFQDDFRLTRLHWGVFAAVILVMALIQVAIKIDSQLLLTLCVVFNRVIGFGILAHLIWTALAGRKDDLIEARRRTRLWFTLGVAIAALLIISGETAHFLYSGTGDDPDWLSTVRTAVAWPMILFGSLWFMGMRSENFQFQPATITVPVAPVIDPKDVVTHQKLIETMEAGAYLEQGLTISGLADKLSVPEHQLRALINKGLGFRNFAGFLNSYRIAHTKRELADPEKARLPVLTIAMDAGYNSLAPFNRAFKAAEGVTPTQFRSDVLGHSDHS